MSKHPARLTLLLSGLIFALALGGCSTFERPLDRQLRRIAENPDAPLASLVVVIVDGGAVVYEGAWGRSRIDAAQPERDQRATPSTKYRVASLSKVVTALGAMQLVEQGKLDLDADISLYLGFSLRNPNYPDRPITARMLLSHTSSLRDGGPYNIPAPYTLRDLFLPTGALYAGGAYFASPAQNAAPGADWGPGAYFAYANVNYGVLGTVMEAITGERFDVYIQEHVLGPLEIDGGFTTDALSDAGFAQLATIYTKQDAQGSWNPANPWRAQLDDFGGIRRYPVPPIGATAGYLPLPHPHAGFAPAPPAPYAVGANATQFAPHAGLRISAHDLAKILLVLLGGGRDGETQIVQPGTVAGMLHDTWHFTDQQPGNGDTLHGRYRAWGLGLQHSTGTLDAFGGDRLARGVTSDFWGHRGEAYGFLGGLWFDTERGAGFIYLIGGLGDDPYRHPGVYSSAYRWEELIQTAILGEIRRRAAGP
jgi:CubicO group peptidase (beta-lactamase class C family)